MDATVLPAGRSNSPVIRAALCANDRQTGIIHHKQACSSCRPGDCNSRAPAWANYLCEQGTTGPNCRSLAALPRSFSWAETKHLPACLPPPVKPDHPDTSVLSCRRVNVKSPPLTLVVRGFVGITVEDTGMRPVNLWIGRGALSRTHSVPSIKPGASAGVTTESSHSPPRVPAPEQTREALQTLGSRAAPQRMAGLGYPENRIPIVGQQRRWEPFQPAEYGPTWSGLRHRSDPAQWGRCGTKKPSAGNLAQQRKRIIPGIPGIPAHHVVLCVRR